MAKHDYYQTLGVAKDANAEAIKKAYRSLAMKYHPDRNSGDKSAEHKFKEISEAYDVLKDEQKRASDVAQAFANGADYIVAGRPVRDAADPRAAAEAIQATIAPVRAGGRSDLLRANFPKEGDR